MSSDPQYITTPVGRLVAGSVDTANLVKDDNGNQKLDAQGQQQFDYYIAVAIPKNPQNPAEHWAHSEWGQVLWNVGHMSFPGGQAQNRPDFAWKVVDGDSKVPNKRNVAPCTREGYPGNWVISFKTSFASDLKNADGTQTIAGGEFYRGCFVQVYASVKGNDSSVSPGIYLNQSIIALAGHGERISSGPDATTVGFGQAPAPAGMSATPLATNFPAQVPGAGGPPPGHPAQQMPPQGQAPAPQQMQQQPPQMQQQQPPQMQQQQPPQMQQQQVQGSPGQPHPQIMSPPLPPQ